MDFADRLGHKILSADHRLLGGLCVLIVVLFVGYKKATKKEVSTLGAARVVFALLMLFSGIVVGCVFLLTNPPACAELSSDLLSLAGLLTMIMTFGFGIKELVTLFSPMSPQEVQGTPPKLP